MSSALPQSPAAGLTPPDSLIFDLDGTLWDSTETVARAWSAALEKTGERGRIITAVEIAGMMGKPHREIYRSMFPGYGEPEQEALVLACYAQEERELHTHGGILYPGVNTGLKHLAKVYPLAIVSNCQQGYIESFLAWSGLGERFTDFECHGNTGLSKGENLELVARRNAWRHPLYVGDTAGDREAAETAGIRFIHAGYGFGDAGPECDRVESFAQLAARCLPPA